MAQVEWAPTATVRHSTGDAVDAGPVPAGQSVDIVVSLKLRHADQLDGLVQAQIRRGGHVGGAHLSHEQIVANFAPTLAQSQAVADYLAGKGFANVRVSEDRMLASATGSAEAVARAFNTRLERFERGGSIGIANLTNAQVPASLAGVVQAVLGLQTLDRMRPMFVRTNSVGPSAFSPLAFPKIYDAAALPTATQATVGIITEGNVSQSITDLRTFESQNGLPAITPTVVQAGSPSSDTTGVPEWDLDSQDIQAMAGDRLAKLIFYNAASFSDANLTGDFDTAVSAQAAIVINVSLGVCETGAREDGSMATDDTLFEMAIAQGQVFSVSSGDSGSNECGGTSPSASYPASSPYVIAVGGTTLAAPQDVYASESAWAYGGGSPSLYEPQPFWQSGIVPGSKRGVPDISFDANPDTGSNIVVDGVVETYGGTSLASPLFVGSWARLQSMHNNGLAYPAVLIYQHGRSASFHDVTTGSNGAYRATMGWDFTTGFGSIDVAQFNKLHTGEAIVPIINYLLR